MAGLTDYNAYLVYPVTKRAIWHTLRTEVESGGLGIWRRKWQNPVFRFKLTYTFFDGTNAGLFLAFFQTLKGASATTSWTCPIDSGTYTCVFEDDELEEALESTNMYRFSANILAVTT